MAEGQGSILTCCPGHTSLSKLVSYVEALMTSIKERLCLAQAGCFWGTGGGKEATQDVVPQKGSGVTADLEARREPVPTLPPPSPSFSVAIWPCAL